MGMKFLVLFACVAAAAAVELVEYPSGAVAPAKTPEVLAAEHAHFAAKGLYAGYPYGYAGFNGYNGLLPELTTTELTPELTLMAHTPTMLVPLLDTPTVPLPPPRPLRSLPLSKLTLPPMASPLPLPLHTPMLPDTLMLPSHMPDSSLTPMEPLSPLNPQMSLLPARNIWLPMLPLKRTN